MLDRLRTGLTTALVCALGLMASSAWAGPPPKISLVELRVRHRAVPGLPAMNKIIRVAHPTGWTGDKEADGRNIRLFGPNGEGEMQIAVVSHPSQLGPILQELKQRHPATVPSPPAAIEVPGINIQKGERATRFIFSGREAGEMVTIERGEVIVLFATLVTPAAWEETVKAQVTRCYPTVEVTDVKKPKK